MVYILEIISLADFRHLGLLCAGGEARSADTGNEIDHAVYGA